MSMLTEIVFTNHFLGGLLGVTSQPPVMPLPDGSGRMIPTAIEGRLETYTYWQLTEIGYQQITTEQASAMTAAAFAKYFAWTPAPPSTVNIEYSVPAAAPLVELMGQPDHGGAGG